MEHSMKRAGVARETVKICEAGHYLAPSGKDVSIADDIKRAIAGTVVYSPESLPAMPDHRITGETKIEIANETSFRGLSRLAALGNEIEYTAQPSIWT